MKKLIWFLLLCPLLGYGQGPQVPSRMTFAGIDLRIQSGAQAEIQRDVDALTHSPKYFKIKADRAAQYFPIIERIFREEGLPEDFKYLVLQESALISDAVSSSNAVGFWQFKEASGGEMGLRMDRQVDERMNIVSASRAAAKYLQKNNYYFNNWVIALQAYQMGAGAAMNAVGEKYNGLKKMTIDKSTYWYVKKFLAHYVAFQGVQTNSGYLKEFTQGGDMSLQQIARDYDVDHEILIEYNKWLKKGKIPMDKEYTVIIPGEGVVVAPVVAATKLDSDKDFDDGIAVKFPEIDGVDMPDQPFILKVNGILGIVSRESDRIESLAEKGAVDSRKFMKYNDIKPGHRVREGQVYYLNAKKKKSRIHYHVLQYDESLWQVSQKYGIKLSALRKKNHIEEGEALKPGRVLWLNKTRSKLLEVQYRSVSPPVEETTIVATASRPSQIEPAPAREAVKEEPTVYEVQAEEPVEKIEKQKEEPESEVIIATPAIDESEDVAGEKIMHHVEAGETLYSVSRKYSVSLNDLLSWNNITLNDPLAIDQQLIIYSSADEVDSDLEKRFNEQTSDFVTYSVRSGDTYYKISRQFNVSVEEIKKWNNKTDNSLSVGEEIRIRR